MNASANNVRAIELGSWKRGAAILTLFAAFVCSSVTACAESNCEAAEEFPFSFSGKNYVAWLAATNIQTSPRWSPSEPLPLSLGRAVKLAEPVAKAFVNGRIPLRACEVSLCAVAPECPLWNYLVRFERADLPPQATGRPHEVVVWVDLAGRVGGIRPEDERSKDDVNERVQSAALARGYGQSNSTREWPVTWQVRGEKQDLVHSLGMLPNIEWSPGEPLPLTVSNAVANATPVASEFAGKDVKLSVGNITWFQHSSQPKSKWFYQIHFEAAEPKQEQDRDEHSNFFVLVDFAGRTGTITRTALSDRPLVRKDRWVITR